MLEYIFDTNEIESEYPDLSSRLWEELDKFRLFEHKDKPIQANALKINTRIKGEPNDYFYYELQYGIKSEEGFEPIGKPEKYSSKLLGLLI